MIIREMSLTDVESVRAIAVAAWRDTYSGFIPADIQEKVLKDAYSNEEIMGYAFFSGDLSDKNGFLESLYVHPNHQGKGIGKQLLLIGLANFKDPTTLSLTVYKGNPNISYYEIEGFEVVKENKGEFYGHPVVFTMMKKNLLNLDS